MRKALLILGRYSKWPRSELRAMRVKEFIEYYDTALELMEKDNGS